MTSLIEKISGCILGGAVGDAVGLPYEGSDAPIEAVELKGQKISDDTQLTLATCEAIIENDGIVDPSVIASRFASWHENRRISGIGASTYKALSELVAGGHWALVGRKGEYAAGNGAAMRIAPLAFCLNPKNNDARQVIRDVSRITHHNEEAYVGALAVTIAVRSAWSGRLDLLPQIIESLPDSKVRDRLAEMAQLEIDTPLRDVARRYGCSGYVVESIPLALYGAQRVSSVGFENLMRELISVGGDTDTIASIAGQVAGTFLGEKGLPQHLFAQLQEVELIVSLAKQFAEKIVANGAG
jgi:ADP-ribosyl-[dinitrogen reductase] hydrolase